MTVGNSEHIGEIVVTMQFVVTGLLVHELLSVFFCKLHNNMIIVMNIMIYDVIIEKISKL